MLLIWARGAVRLTLGRTTTESDVDRAIDAFVGAVQRLRPVDAGATVGAK